MTNVSCFIILLLAVVIVSGNVEQFDEVAWMDNSARDKYFEYLELSEPATDSSVNDSDKIDSSQFEETKTRPLRRRHTKDKSSVVDVFLNTISSTVKKFIEPNRSNLETNNVDLASPDQENNNNFGSNQDIQLIYLGTKWCGAGDIAKNKRDIGYFYLTDSCCRAHDHCPKAIEEQKSNYGLRNNGKFTKSHCDCDDEFYDCLKSVNSLVSKQVGLLYFSVLGPQCFKEDYPLTCKEKARGRCVSYSRDWTQPKRYQWIDNKFF